MSQDDLSISPALDAAWRDHHAAVEQARRSMQQTARFKTGQRHRAELYHSIMEAEAMAYSFAIAPRLDQPMVHNHSWFSYFYTLGGTSPDFRNGTAFLDGRRTYRLVGRFGDLKLILAQVYSHLLGHPNATLVADADFATFALDAGGSFEVTMSATRQPGNWIPLDPDSDCNFVFIRRIGGDWHGDRGDLDVSLVDGPVVQDDFDEAAMARRVSRATDFLNYLVGKWNIGIYDLYLAKAGGEKNAFSVVPGQSIATDYAGSSATNYIWCVFDIADDEALIIETEVPQARYWSFQTMSVWCKPFDFIHRQTDINMQRAVIDADGRCRGVVSASDPGVANWLDTAGRSEGIITGRAYHSSGIPARPVTRIVKLAELRRHLPADTTFVSPAERQQALAYRRAGYLKLYGD